MSISGKTILNTRPVEDSESFNSILESNGAKILSFPCIQIKPVDDFSELDGKISSLDNYYGVIFTSSNAVKIFFQRLNLLNVKFGGRIFAVGERTKATLTTLGADVTYIPENYDSRELAKKLAKEREGNKPYLFPSGNLSMKTLTSYVDNVDTVTVYSTIRPNVTSGTEGIKKRLINKEIDCIAFFSPSAVNNFVVFFPEYQNGDSRISVIGKTTMHKAGENGLIVDIIAKTSTSQGLASAIIDFFDE